MRSLNGLAVAFGLCLLAIAMVCCGGARLIQDNQTGLQALVGGVADASGVTTLTMGVTGRDLATGRHQGLSDSQQRPLVVEGGIWFLAILLFLCLAVRVGLMTLRGPSEPTKKKGEIRQSPKKQKTAMKKGGPGTKKGAS
jgi:hypothetical protein